MQESAEISPGSIADQPAGTFDPPPRRRSARPTLLVALLAFIGGGALAGWLVWSGDLDTVLPKNTAVLQAAAPVARPLANAPTPAGGNAPQIAPTGLGVVETRLALLEDRFSRIDQQANAASANASRAEALLIALAARRMLDRGEPLGYLEYQLKLRFGGAQPQAVQTIVAAGHKPITLYMLSSQLEAASPALSGERSDESTWARVSRELSSLFVVRRNASPATKPRDRAERAQVLLKAGRVEDAIAEVERLPGAADAQDWIDAARRYDKAQRALEIIEAAAMLAPRELRDGQGMAVIQPSPLTPPAEAASVQ